jgi:hypothetical protein
MSAPKTRRKRSKTNHDGTLRVRLTPALYRMLQSEAFSDARTVSSLVRKILIDELKRRGAFTSANVQ